MFWRYDLEARTYIREIFPGHWAFCPELQKEAKRQYELVAARNINEGEWIGEYTGTVDFRINCGQKYTAAYYMPDTVDLVDGDLCVDGENYGNETRYINSLSPSSPDYITKNATMTTVWCAEQLRIGIFALKAIKKYCAIIVDYNEYSNSYFKPHSEEEEELKTPYVFITCKDQYGDGPVKVSDSESTQEITDDKEEFKSYRPASPIDYIDLTTSPS